MTDVISNHPHVFLGSRLKRLAEQMQADASAITHRAGIPVPAGLFAVLATLEAHGPQTVSALAEALSVSQPSMTQNIGKLAAVTLVQVQRGTTDRRQSVISLTPAGQAAITEGRRQVWPLIGHAVQELTDNLSGPFVDQLDEIERRLTVRSLSDRASAKAAVVLRPAAEIDLPAVAALLNRAYRSAGADASWNTEAAYMEGDRTSTALLRSDIAAKSEATLLVWDLWNVLQGCVMLEPLGETQWYLGSLAVSPVLQNAQAGRRLLEASEDWIRARGGRHIRITVVNVRDTLIAWYERRGYRLTGETEPYPYADARFGTPKRPDLCFVVMDKAI